MDAFSLAERFREFVRVRWTDHEDRVQQTLFRYFEVWTQELYDGEDLIALTGGNYTLALQTWIAVSAWFAQRPEDFPAIQPFVTGQIEYTDWPLVDGHDIRMQVQGLPGLLDQNEWNRRVFERQSRPVPKVALWPN